VIFSCCCCCCCPWKWTHLISVNFAYGLIFFLYIFLLNNLVFYFFLVLSNRPVWCYNEHILLHIESLTTTHPGFGCPLLALYARTNATLKTTNHPKFILIKIVFFFSVMNVYIRRMNNRRKLILNTIISSLLSREQPTMSQIGLEDKQIGSRLCHRWLLHLSESKQTWQTYYVVFFLFFLCK